MKYLRNVKKNIKKKITIYRKDLWDSKRWNCKQYANKMKIEYDGRKPRCDKHERKK